ncbi:MAG: hypothetical protein FJ137_21515 [Deltaproteobacteria bacterium]|nr:hypothetical protein [Deltaproteobacteria bacterium]
MLGRLREIDDELHELPDQLDPLAKKISSARDVVARSEQNNPLHTSLIGLLSRADRAHIANLGWLVGKPVLSAPDVARSVDSFLIKILGRDESTASDPGQSYEKSLARFIRAEGGASIIPTGVLEAALLKKLFGDPWLALDAKLRTGVMETLHGDLEQNQRWLPETRDQVLSLAGLSIVGEGAGAFGAYFTAAAVIAIGARQYKLHFPTQPFASLPGTLKVLAEDGLFERLVGRLVDAAGSGERARAIIAVAYVHMIRAIHWGHFEREHGKLQTALSSVEVALENGKRRLVRLRDERNEILLQATGVIGFTTMLIGGLAYVVQLLLAG